MVIWSRARTPGTLNRNYWNIQEGHLPDTQMTFKRGYIILAVSLEANCHWSVVWCGVVGAKPRGVERILPQKHFVFPKPWKSIFRVPERNVYQSFLHSKIQDFVQQILRKILSLFTTLSLQFWNKIWSVCTASMNELVLFSYWYIHNINETTNCYG